MRNKKIQSLMQLVNSPELSQSPELVGIESKDFSIDLVIRNGRINSKNTLRQITEFMGGVTASYSYEEDTGHLRLSASRVQMPESYSFFNVAKYIEVNSSKGWFLGIDKNGPVHFPFHELTHMALVGSTGYGKSIFFRNLLAQTLQYHSGQVINYIIDPKRVGYSGLRSHPASPIVCESRSEWEALFGTLLLECAERKRIFANSFENAPNNLEEYHKMKAEHQRADLPDLKRMIVWVDEAHAIYNDDYSNSFSKECSAYLARTARAFGIHLVLTTQRVADIPNDIRSQANLVGTFFQGTNWGPYVSDRLNKAEIKPIRGRLWLDWGMNDEPYEIQTPYLDSLEAIGFGLRNKADVSSHERMGFQPIKIRKDVLESLQIINSIITGTSLELIGKSTSDPKRGEPYRRSNSIVTPDDFKFLGKYSPDQKKNIPGKVDEEPKIIEVQIKRDFFSSFEEDEEDSHSAPDTKASDAPSKKWLVLQEIKKTNNLPSYDELTQKVEDRLKDSPCDLRWLLKDLNKNETLKSIVEGFLSPEDDFSEHRVRLEDYAMPQAVRAKVDTFLTECKTALARRSRPPILILYGKDNTGKLALAQAIAQELNFPIRAAAPADLKDAQPKVKVSPTNRPNTEAILAGAATQAESRIADSSEQRPNINSESDVKKTKSEVVVFDNLEYCVRYNRNTSTMNLAIMIATVPPATVPSIFQLDYESAFNPKNLKFMYDPHSAIDFNAGFYTTADVKDSLVHSLLKQVGYEWSPFEKASLLPDSKLFQKHKVDLQPGALFSFLKKAKLKSELKAVAFNKDFLQSDLDLHKSEPVNTPAAVQVIEPKKTLNDLFVDEDTRIKLNQLIDRAKMMEATNYVFLEKMRKRPRTTALFSGPPGTGKTLTAEVIAGTLGKDLWLCDYSRLISCYVGESEKNLAEVFAKAEEAGVVLLIDECDVLFSARGTGAKYDDDLTQQALILIENYSGVVIATSNRPEVMDSAMARRFDGHIRFQEPKLETQVAILKGLLEPDAPVVPNLSYEEILRGSRLTGGYIRNAVERAFYKMISLKTNQITAEILIEAIEEVSDENHLINRKTRPMGIAI